jgi:predicted nucleic acid-binding protein
VILLDTNVISELVRPQPDMAVVAYLSGLAPETVFTAAVCEAEIRYGLARMANERKRNDLIVRVDALFETGFQGQVLRFDRACAMAYGEVRHSRQAAGRPITVEDAMIAATARAYAVQAIATRNTKDFDGCGVTLIDPWLTE